jgi:hypothetical protein
MMSDKTQAETSTEAQASPAPACIYKSRINTWLVGREASARVSMRGSKALGYGHSHGARLNYVCQRPG